MTLVYLAGKVRKIVGDTLVPGLRDAFTVEEELPDSTFAVPTLHRGVFMNGPFFIACDHGCSHGEGSHGVLSDSTCDQQNRTRQEVYHRSIRAIEDADRVFCWIDAEGAYGTAVEIGFARALEKKVFIAMDENAPAVLPRDMWFLFEGRNISFYKNAREAFLDMLA